MFQRKIYRAMLEWKNRFAPHYALFLRGARRVGKTTLAEKLGREAKREGEIRYLPYYMAAMI